MKATLTKTKDEVLVTIRSYLHTLTLDEALQLRAALTTAITDNMLTSHMRHVPNNAQFVQVQA